MSTRQKRRVVDKTAAYAVSRLNDECGTIFTNRGAVAGVTFTLPTPNFSYLGDFYDFRAIADYALTVAGATAGDVVTKNDAAANSVAASTAGEIIGASLRAECIRTGQDTYKWLVYGLAVGHTYTVAT